MQQVLLMQKLLSLRERSYKDRQGLLVCVQLTFRSSSWQTQQGETRYENAVTISNIAPFGLRVTEGSES